MIGATNGQVLVFESQARTIMFEFDQALPNGFVSAKKWCNSIALSTGHFPEYCFNGGSVRHATDEELQEYDQIKSRSQYQFNAD